MHGPSILYGYVTFTTCTAPGYAHTQQLANLGGRVLCPPPNAKIMCVSILGISAQFGFLQLYSLDLPVDATVFRRHHTVEPLLAVNTCVNLLEQSFAVHVPC